MRSLLVCFALFFANTTQLGWTQQRIALVIGNSSYDQNNGGYLVNPIQDAQVMAEALETVGFRTTLLTDLDENGIERAILDHQYAIERAGPGAVSFFYYSGHGATDSHDSLGGSNFMIPIHSSLRTPSDLRVEGVRLSDAIDAFAAATMSFVVFDACRDFPFASSATRNMTRGFKPEQDVQGTFIAFSSAPKTVAFDNSGYAKALADEIMTPGNNHLDVFTRVRTRVYENTNRSQFPWYRDGVIGDFVFVPEDESASREESNNPLLKNEKNLWDQLSGSCSGLETYVNIFPNGTYVSEARTRLTQPSCAGGGNSTEDLANESRNEIASKDASTAVSDGLAAYNEGNYSVALANWQVSCDKESAQGCYNLGYLHAHGLGVPKDAIKGTSIYEKACGLGNADGCTNSGRNFKYGWDVAKDQKRGFDYLVKACDLGDDLGCHDLAHSYRYGLGTAQEQATARVYYEAACDMGYLKSCTDLGYMYDYGLGGPEDKALSVSLQTKACNGDNWVGCNRLGVAYETGDGIATDASAAATYYQRACDNDYYLACSNLGDLYQDGRGVSQNHTRAKSYFEKGCDGDDGRSCYFLGHIYDDDESDDGVATDLTLAASYFEKSCLNDYGSGCYYIGDMYNKGQGVAQDYDKAIEVLQHGCDEDDEYSCNLLANNHYSGYGVTQDYTEAKILHEKACRMGSDTACANVGLYYHYGNGVAVNLVIARQHYKTACDKGANFGCSQLDKLDNP